jgi:hypothetical protein
MKQQDREGEINDNQQLMRENSAHVMRTIDRSNCIERANGVKHRQRIDVLYIDIVFPSGVWHDSD